MVVGSVAEATQKLSLLSPSLALVGLVVVASVAASTEAEAAASEVASEEDSVVTEVALVAIEEAMEATEVGMEEEAELAIKTVAVASEVDLLLVLLVVLVEDEVGTEEVVVVVTTTEGTAMAAVEVGIVAAEIGVV